MKAFDIIDQLTKNPYEKPVFSRLMRPQLCIRIFSRGSAKNSRLFTTREIS